MSERPEEALKWLKNVGTNRYWTHPNPPITLVDQAKARRNEILTELMQYVDRLEASEAILAEAKVDSKRLDKLEATEGCRIFCEGAFWIVESLTENAAGEGDTFREAIDKLEELE